MNISKYGSVEIPDILVQMKVNNNFKKTAVNATERFPAIYDEFTDTGSAFDIERYEWKQYENKDIQELGNLDDNYNTLTVEGSDMWIQNNLDWSWESMNDRMTEHSENSESARSLPGFGLICSGSAVLLISVLMRKR